MTTTNFKTSGLSNGLQGFLRTSLSSPLPVKSILESPTQSTPATTHWGALSSSTTGIWTQNTVHKPNSTAYARLHRHWGLGELLKAFGEGSCSIFTQCQCQLSTRGAISQLPVPFSANNYRATPADIYPSTKNSTCCTTIPSSLCDTQGRQHEHQLQRTHRGGL